MTYQFSVTTAKLQQEWIEKLQRTATDLQCAATAALRTHAAYVEAMERLGALYAFCGTLINRVSAQQLADPPPAAELRQVMETSTQLHSSLERWRDAGEEFELHTLLLEQTTHWQMGRKELIRFNGDFKRRKNVYDLLHQAQSKLKAEVDRKSPSVRKLEREVAELRANLKICDDRVRQTLTDTAKDFCKDVSDVSIKLVDVLSACGQTCAMTFQPVVTSLLSTVGEGGQRSRHGEAQGNAMAGVVLHRSTLAASSHSSSSASSTGTATYGEPAAYLPRLGSTVAVGGERTSTPAEDTALYRDPAPPSETAAEHREV